MKMKRVCAAGLSLLLALTLGGCTSGITALDHGADVTLPPVSVS